MCFEAGKEYDRALAVEEMEITCMLCDKEVSNLVEAKTEFGFVYGGFRPRESCRECRRGDKNDSINDIRDDLVIDNYDSEEEEQE